MADVKMKLMIHEPLFSCYFVWTACWDFFIGQIFVCSKLFIIVFTKSPPVYTTTE